MTKLTTHALDTYSGKPAKGMKVDVYFISDKREKIKYINKITKGVYELGSVFKTFTIALAIENNLVTPKTIIKNIPRKLKCSIHEISDIKEFPKNLESK